MDDHMAVVVGGRASPGPSADGRDAAIDVLRGWSILMMVATHVGPPTFARRLTHAGPVYLTGTHGFVFLSGLVLGFVTRRRLLADQEAVINRKILRRAALLWMVHCILTIGLVAAHEAIGDANNLFIDEEAPDRVRLFVARVPDHGGWPKTLWLIATLRFQPDYMDILPMYILLLLATPPALSAIRRGHTGLCLLASASLYLAAQVRPGLLNINRARISPEVYDLAAWQVLFFGGLCLGYRRREIARAFGPKRTACLMGACLVVLGADLALAQVQAHEPVPGLMERWYRVASLGPGNLLDFAARMTLGYYLVSSMLRHGLLSPPLRWIGLIGRHSLYCFLVHLAFLVLLLAIGSYRWRIRWQEVCVALSWVLLYLMARYRILARVVPN